MNSNAEPRHRAHWLVVAAAAVGLLATLAGPAPADYWYESWDDNNAVNPPLNWGQSALFPGFYGFREGFPGTYILEGQDVQEDLGIVTNDNEILASVAVSGDASPVSFTNFLSVRTRARLELQGNIGITFFVDLGDPNPFDAKGYGAVVDAGGGLFVEAFNTTINQQDLVDGSYADPNLSRVSGLLDPSSDPNENNLFMQVDMIDTNATGDPSGVNAIAVSVWFPGQPQPTEPTQVIRLDVVPDPPWPFPGDIRAQVPTQGLVGVNYVEDARGGEKPEGTGYFSWIMASESALINGDVNGDGVVDNGDVAPFLDVLLNGPYNPLADMNNDDVIDGLDVAGFVAKAGGGGGGGVNVIPEPSTLLLALAAALGLTACLWRQRRTDE